MVKDAANTPRVASTTHATLPLAAARRAPVPEQAGATTWVAGWLAFAVVIIAITCHIAALLLERSTGLESELWRLTLLGFPIVGAVIIGRQPRNTIGWILASGGLTIAIARLCGAIVHAML